MNFGCISHRTCDNYCYAIDDETLEINLKTGYDIEEVNLFYSDPFDGGILGGDFKWNPYQIKINNWKRLKYHKLWTIQIQPPHKRLKYCFEIKTKDECYYYFEDGFFTKEELVAMKKDVQCFIMPWMNPVDVNKTPDWVSQTNWYQIFIDRFNDGDPSNNPFWAKPWGSDKPSNRDSYGGDLQGIIDKLEYLRNLGITGLYLTPIFEAASIHKYDTLNYFEIDPIFGDKLKFKELVDKAHNLGMKIMLDGVFNHVSDISIFWKDVLEKGENSKYYNWFMINDWPINNLKNTRNNEYYSFAFQVNMPKLNTNNDEVIDYICNVCTYWVKEFDIDGWRLDVANEISHKLAKKMRLAVKSIKEDCYIMGEIWHDSINWLLGDEFDSVMNYPLKAALDNFWFNLNATNLDFEYNINEIYSRYMQQTNKVLFNLLDSHDTQRLINHLDFNKDIFLQQLAVLYTMPGTPCIYYGTEIMLDGKHDPDCRKCMPWDEIEKGKYDNEIVKVSKLLNMRLQYKECRYLKIDFKYDLKNKRIIDYFKGDKLEVILNCSDSKININRNGNIIFENLYKNNELLPNGILIMYYD